MIAWMEQVKSHLDHVQFQQPHDQSTDNKFVESAAGASRNGFMHQASTN